MLKVQVQLAKKMFYWTFYYEQSRDHQRDNDSQIRKRSWSDLNETIKTLQNQV